MTGLSPTAIARVCHEANRAYRAAVGQDPGPDWLDAGVDMQASSVKGVRAALDGATPEQLHESWSAERTAAGWTFGEVKDTDAKTHPCLVPYADLPEDDRRKDALFACIVAALS